MEIKCYLSNCILATNEKIPLNIAGYDIYLVQDKYVSFKDISKYKGTWVELVHLVFRKVKSIEIEKDKIKKIAENISSLLSLATLSPVRLYKMESNNEWIYLNHLRNGNYSFFRPLINLFETNDIKEYLELTYNNFVEQRDRRQLNVVIEYLISSTSIAMPFELKLATMFILLENLKKTYADEEGFPFINGFYRYKKNKKVNIGLKELLKRMFSLLGNDIDVSKIVDLRDEIIHSGLSQTSHEKQYKIYENTHDIVHEYLLRLLKYKGNYYIYSKASRQIKKM